MTTLFIILIILVSVILGFIVLVQNPKGGGLSGSIAGFSDQFMGVKQTTDVLEKGTWIFAGLIGVLCLVSSFFITSGGGNSPSQSIDKATNAPVPVNKTITPPVNTAPANTVPLTGDSAK